MTWLAGFAGLGILFICGWLVTVPMKLYGPNRDIFLLRVATALALGTAFTSMFFFCSLLLGFERTSTYAIIESIIVICSGMVLYRRSATVRCGFASGSTVAGSTPRWIGVTAFIVALFAATAICLRMANFPMGESDAWSIWNLRARFLFSGGDYWMNGFDPIAVWSPHRDYPLLVPASVARLWGYIQQNSVLIPAFFSALFLIVSAAFITSLLNVVKGRPQGWIALVTLLGSAIYVRQGGYQMADVPLSCYILVTLGIMVLHDHHGGKNQKLLLLAGLALGFCAWTKNEGWLFLISFLIVRSFVLWRDPGKDVYSQMGRILLGLLIALPIVLFFKNASPQNDLVANALHSQMIWSKLLDIERHVMISFSFASITLKLLKALVVLIPLYLLTVGIQIDARIKASVTTILLVIGLVLVGYYAVYLITPHDLEWHLSSSVDRLLVHLWPSVILVVFLMARPFVVVKH